MDVQDRKEQSRSAHPEAEIVAENRMDGSFEIRLSLAGQSYRIRHKKSLMKQIVFLDGERVAEGGSLLRMHKRFIIPLNDAQKTAVELRLQGSNLDVIKFVSLNVDGVTVLDEALKPPPLLLRAALAVSGLAFIGVFVHNLYRRPDQAFFAGLVAGLLFLVSAAILSRKFTR